MFDVFCVMIVFCFFEDSLAIKCDFILFFNECWWMFWCFQAFFKIFLWCVFGSLVRVYCFLLIADDSLVIVGWLFDDFWWCFNDSEVMCWWLFDNLLMILWSVVDDCLMICWWLVDEVLKFLADLFVIVWWLVLIVWWFVGDVFAMF